MPKCYNYSISHQFKSDLWHSYYVLGWGWGEQEGIHCLVREGLRNLGSIAKCFRGCGVSLSISHMWHFNCEYPHPTIWWACSYFWEIPPWAPCDLLVSLASPRAGMGHLFWGSAGQGGPGASAHRFPTCRTRYPKCLPACGKDKFCTRRTSRL